jgi:hypothetical protein
MTGLKVRNGRGKPGKMFRIMAGLSNLHFF